MLAKRALASRGYWTQEADGEIYGSPDADPAVSYQPWCSCSLGRPPGLVFIASGLVPHVPLIVRLSRIRLDLCRLTLGPNNASLPVAKASLQAPRRSPPLGRRGLVTCSIRQVSLPITRSRHHLCVSNREQPSLG